MDCSHSENKGRAGREDDDLKVIGNGLRESMLEKSGRDPLTLALLKLRITTTGFVQMFTAMDGKILKNIHIADSRYVQLIRIVYLPTNQNRQQPTILKSSTLTHLKGMKEKQ